MKTKRSNNLTIEKVLAGEEPVWNQKGELSFIRALNWYSNVKNPKDSKEYLLDYVKLNKFDKKQISKLSSLHENHFSNVGFLCRMLSRGASLEEFNISYIEKKIKNLLEFNEKNSEESSEEVEDKKPNIQDRIFDQATQYINEIEGHVDFYIKNRTSTFKCYDWLTINSVKPIYISHIKDHYAPLEEELKLALNKQDEQLQESYSHWTKKELSAYLAFISGILKDCNDYSSNTKTVKKTRKKKSVSVDKKISKLKFKKEDSQYKLVSINPTSILSATKLWVFNTKTKKLGLYISKELSGFSIKGTTLEGFDEKSSVQKTLRKPEEQLKFVLDKKISGKKFHNDFWESIKTVESPLTGRINEDTILIKVL